MIVEMNLILALFNLIPIPPLDGSKILFSFIPAKFRQIENFLERWGIFFLLFFIIFLWSKVAPLIYIAFSFITGLS
jgi:Zn-dependent protease